MLKLRAFKTRFIPLSISQLMSPKTFNLEEWDVPQQFLYHHFSDAPLTVNLPFLDKVSLATVYPVTSLPMSYVKGKDIGRRAQGDIKKYLTRLEKPLVRGVNLERDLDSLSTLPIRDYHFLDEVVRYINNEPEGSKAAERKALNLELNRLESLLDTLAIPTTAAGDVVFIKAPVSVPTLQTLKRSREDFEEIHLKIWSNPSLLLVRELFNSIRDTTHSFHKRETPLIISFEKAGQVSSLEVKQLLEWGSEKPTEVETALVKFVTEVSSLSVMKTDTSPTVDEEEIEGVEAPEEEVEEVLDTTDEHGDTVAEFVPGKTIDVSGVQQAVRKQQQTRNLSAAEVRRIDKLASKYKEIPALNGKGTLLEEIEEAKKAIKQDLFVPSLADKKAISDKSLLSASTKRMVTEYIEKGVLEADITSSLIGMNKAGYMIQDISAEDKGDAINYFTEYKVKYTPVDGISSTVTFSIPKISSDGEFIANGVKYRLTPQKGDMPIRKTGPDKVALTSDYGKVGITRSAYKAYSIEGWFSKKILAEAKAGGGGTLTEIKFTTGTPEQLPLSRTFSAIASSVTSFAAKGITFLFSSKEVKALVGDEKFSSYLEKGLTLTAKRGTKLYALDLMGNLIEIEGTKETDLGGFSLWLNPEWGNPPNEFININVRGSLIPVVVVMGYIMSSRGSLDELYKSKKVKEGSQGLQAVIDFIGIEHRWSKTRISDPKSNETMLRFQGEYLYYNHEDRKGSMILSGLKTYEKVIRTMAASDFNAAGVYGELLDIKGLRNSLVKEMTLMDELLVDSIMEELLIEMGEPTTFLELLVRASEMLVTDDHKNETYRYLMRDRGYDRIAGFVNRALINGVREHRNNPYPSKAGLSIPKKDIWNAIVSDQSIMLVEESNPVHNQKEMDALTYTGTGGRSGRTMTAKTRMFHKEDIGSMTEAVPDSSKVGVRASAPPGAKYNSLRGTVTPYDFKTDGPGNAISAVGLLLPGTQNTDPKRALLAAVQQSSMVSCVGGTLTPLRTGAEMTWLERCGDGFGVAAKEKGKVTALDESSITVEYGKDNVKVYPLGLKHGLAAGAVLPHRLVTDLKVGAKLEKGNAITWNEAYFTRDILNPGGVSLKGGFLATTWFKDDPDTLEDGSLISKAGARKLSTPVTKRHTFLRAFTDEIFDLLPVGTEVTADSVLMRVEDSVISGLASSSSTLEGLEKLGAKFPKAKQEGVISHIECIYQGKVSDMTPSLAKIIKEDNKRRLKESKMEGRSLSPTGEIAETSYFNKVKVIPNTVAISVFIDYFIDAEGGDKIVIDNPLKSIASGVMGDDTVTESGRDIHIKFALQSVDNRILFSAIRSGICNTYLDAASSEVVRAFYS